MQFSKSIHVIIFLCFFTCSLSTAYGKNELKTDSVEQLAGFVPDITRLALVDSILRFGKRLLNTTYRYGASGKKGFDCSGFTSHVFGNFGYKLYHSSAQQSRQFPSVKKTEILPGDLVFYEGRKRNGRVGHVGIIVDTLSNGEFSFIHASVQEGVTISNSTADYYKRRFVGAARVIGGMASGTSPIAEITSPNPVGPEIPVPETKPATYHFVKHGETLYSIARKYGLSVAELKTRNQLSRDIIQIKQKLLIFPAENTAEN